MLAQELIRAKRDGSILTAKEIQFFVDGLVDQSISDSQVAAFAMAVFFQGMTREEGVALTSGIQHSGSTLDWSGYNFSGPVVDKHSTGGVGDKVSLMLASILAACGAYVPMISGRGLGHTGGTLDKMESIPGYNATPDISQLQKVVSQCGCAIVGQTAELAPADKRLYSIRDVTSTVESIPLITASILSKKLAAGLDALVMDVKTGSGAFAASQQMAEDLARNIAEVGEGLGLKTTALITDMSQVLGFTAGNALEVHESIDYLTGKQREARLHQVVVELVAELLVSSGLEGDSKQAKIKINQVLDSGLAAEKFEEMVVALGGPSDLLSSTAKYLEQAGTIIPVYAENIQNGRVKSIDVRALGNAIVEIGGGRRLVTDRIDHAVGFSQIKGIGDKVDDQEPLLMLHINDESKIDSVTKRILSAYKFEDIAENSTKDSESITVGNSVILKRITA
ncbi:MAG: thymidine phosphorylase [Gammaproteobacteria bacterium]|nr:thymidine phosphorylase [Gammaproteobacteria bacterium]MDH5628769.1 thymidine phosphorylase [Gammaproteobacteria bacterium]